MKKAFLTAMTALSIVAAPTMAAAAPIATPLTQPLSQPASETVEGDNALHGGAGVFVLILAVIAIGLGIAAGVSGNDSPNSP